MQQKLIKILEAKDKRYTIRKEFARQDYATISVNLNIPGYPKSNDLIRQTFLLVKQELQKYLIASRIAVISDKIKIQYDEAGDICFFPIRTGMHDLKLIKEELELFEQKHSLGRLIDVDVFDNDLNPISSGKKKSCFLCVDQSAIACMKENRHSYEELRTHLSKQIDKFLEAEKKESLCKRISMLATQAILMEVSLPGKPGLVCPESQGSHTDMNYLTFIQSTSAISMYFNEIAELGFAWDGVCPKNIVRQLRTIGLKMEEEMLIATKGINTQKGIIFLMGYSLFTSAHILKTKKYFDLDLFRDVLRLLNQGLVNMDLENGWNKNASHGEKSFTKFGKKMAGGIRHEIEQGLPTLFGISLPYMQKLFPHGAEISEQYSFQQKLLKVLISIMSVNNDTNILHRADVEVLEELKALASAVMNSKEELAENIHYTKLVDYCKIKNISPGGSADMMAITLFVYQVINAFSHKKSTSC